MNKFGASVILRNMEYSQYKKEAEHCEFSLFIGIMKSRNPFFNHSTVFC